MVQGIYNNPGQGEMALDFSGLDQLAVATLEIEARQTQDQQPLEQLTEPNMVIVDQGAQLISTDPAGSQIQNIQVIETVQEDGTTTQTAASQQQQQQEGNEEPPAKKRRFQRRNSKTGYHCDHRAHFHRFPGCVFRCRTQHR